MKKQSIDLLEQVFDLLTVYQAMDEYQGLNEEEQEFLNVLWLVYDLLTRTKFAQSEGEKYGISSSEVANLAFGLVTKTGKVDMRRLLHTATFGHYRKDIADGVGIRLNTISDYMSGKSSMTTDNFEKIINFTFDKMKTYKLIKTRAGERTGVEVSEFYGTGMDDLNMINQVQDWLVDQMVNSTLP